MPKNQIYALNQRVCVVLEMGAIWSHIILHFEENVAIIVYVTGAMIALWCKTEFYLIDIVINN
jgi:hypothetical protein